MHPPKAAVSLLNVFAPDGESVVGDLMEEFQTAIAPRYGRMSARVWFWGQVLRSIGHLARIGARRSPGRTIAAALGGYLVIMVLVMLSFTGFQFMPASGLRLMIARDALFAFVAAGIGGYVASLIAKGRGLH